MNVALGMIGALKNCAGAGYVSEQDVEAMCEALLRVYGLPVKTGGVV